MPKRVLVCLPHNFSRTMSFSPLIDGARCPLAEEIDACLCQDRQAEMHSDPDRDFFCYHEILFCILQRVNISKLIFMYLQQELSPG